MIVSILLSLFFWICLLVLVHVYLGYPLILRVLRCFYHRPVKRSESYEPTVTIIIAAYNEEDNIERAIRSALGQEYPKEKLEIIVGSDGSTDRTADIVRSFSEEDVKLLDLPRSGKAITDNALVAAAQGEIIVSTSAFAYAPSSWVRALVRNFADPEVGCATGANRIVNLEASNTSRSESTYWVYEWWLRMLEGELGILSVSNGACHAFRRSLYQPITPSSDVDRMVPLQVIEQGYRVVHDSNAWVYEESISSPSEEIRSRTRQVSRGIRDILRKPHLLNPLRYPGTTFSLWSRRLLRWSTPLFLLGILVCSGLMATDSVFYRILFFAQLAFYAIAGLIIFAGRYLALPRFLYLPASFLLVNLAIARGLINTFLGREITKWRD